MENVDNKEYYDAFKKLVTNLCDDIIIFVRKGKYSCVLYLFNQLERVDELGVFKDKIAIMLVAGLCLSCKNKSLDLINLFLNQIEKNHWKISLEVLSKVNTVVFEYEDEYDSVSLQSCIDICFQNGERKIIELLLEKNIVLKNDLGDMYYWICNNYKKHSDLTRWVLENFKIEKDKLKKEFKNQRVKTWDQFEEEFDWFLDS